MAATFRLYNEPQGFTPLFRLLDDFDSYSRQQQGNTQQHHHQGRRHGSIPTFQPRFDVRELQDSYELHGEVPGLEKNNVEIEFTDTQTILVRGRIERVYTTGTPPAGAALEDISMSGAVTEKGEDASPSHKATVEDDEEEPVEASPEAGHVVKHDKKTATTTPKGAAKDSARYWVQERTVGEFSRTFNFPGHVDQQGVKATLNDGILSIVVPKAKKPAARRVAIE